MKKIPNHIAFIMDGNGRWAKEKNRPRQFGHKAGSENLQKLIEEIDKLNIKYVTVYAFSTENWNRPQDEVDYLMNLMENYLNDNIREAKKRNYKITVIGEKTRLRKDLVKKIENLEEITKDKTGLHLTIAISYGGKDEIIRTAKNIYNDINSNIIDIKDLNEDLFTNYLDTKDTPDPDLLIRTGGEMRISNFLIWQLAYTELYFSDRLWPDFNIDDLNIAIKDYQNRDRRFGSLN